MISEPSMVDFTLAGSTVIDEGGIVWNMTTISGSPELGIFLIGRYNLTAQNEPF